MYTFMIIEGKSTILKLLVSKSHCPTIRRKELISSHAIFFVDIGKSLYFLLFNALCPLLRKIAIME